MLIVPDTHGRSFWQKPVKKTLGKEHIVFLGDYVDPYRDEGISPWDTFSRFQEIVELKKAHPGDITLLLGNHDLHYLSMMLLGGRYDFESEDRIRKLIEDNSDLFALTCTATAGGKKFLFSHAGIQRGWLLDHSDIFEGTSGLAASTVLNFMWEKTSFRQPLFYMLSDVSYARMGNKPFGSPVWNDVDDMAPEADNLPGWYQIFGHSQQENNPVIRTHFACLDCRRVFRLTEAGEIVEYN